MSLARCQAPFELVDLWPTIASLAGITPPPLCPPIPAVMGVATCTEGANQAALVRGLPTAKHKGAAFSQYLLPAPIDRCQCMHHASIYLLPESRLLSGCRPDYYLTGFYPVRCVNPIRVFRVRPCRYPRPSLAPQNSSELPNLADIEFMGYVRTRLSGYCLQIQPMIRSLARQCILYTYLYCMLSTSSCH